MEKLIDEHVGRRLLTIARPAGKSVPNLTLTVTIASEGAI